MKAKIVNEDINFEKEQDPKKTMGLGINGYQDYVKLKSKQLGISPQTLFDYIYMEYEETPSYELIDMVYEVLGHTSIEYQIDFIDNEIEAYKNDYLNQK